MLPDFTKYVDWGALFVEPPSHLIFLCGGKIQAKSPSFTSIRDAFLKIPDNPALHNRTVLLAEQVNTFHLSRPAYPDLLTFELDFAQVCELNILFSESQGSIAELGAFSMMEELASKMLVVVQDCYLAEDSFINLGPLRHLRLNYGDHSVFVINDDDTGMNGSSIMGLNLSVLRDRLAPAIENRFMDAREKVTFNPSRRGHIAKLMVGLCQ